MDDEAFAQILFKTLARTAYLILALLATMMAVAKLGIDQIPLVGDQQHSFYLATEMADGNSPYIDGSESKPALGILLPGLSISLARPVGIEAITATRMLATATMAACFFLTQCLVFRLTRSILAGVAGGVALLGYAAFTNSILMGNEPRIYLVLFTLLTALALAGRRTRWAGAASMAACLCWQPALLLLLAAAAASILAPPVGHGWKRGLYSFLSGAVIPVVPFLAFFLVCGGLANALWQPLVAPFQALDAVRTGTDPNSLLGALAEFNGHGTLLFWIALAAFLRLLLVGSGKWPLPPRPPADAETGDDEASEDATPPLARPTVAALAVIGLTILATALARHRDPGDLLFLAPFVAVGVGLACALLTAEARRLGSLFAFLTAITLATATAIGSIFLASQSTALLARQAAANIPEHIDRPPAPTLPYTLADQRGLAASLAAQPGEERHFHAIRCTHLLAFANLPNSPLIAGSDDPRVAPAPIVLDGRSKALSTNDPHLKKHTESPRDAFLGQGIRYLVPHP